MKRRLKVNGAIIFLAFMAVVFFPGIFFRQQKLTLPELLAKLLGFASILLGQLLRICARGVKAEYSQDGCTLIKKGPYLLVRNPMYLGIVLMGAGIVTVFFKWWVAGIFAVVFILRYIALIFQEEKELEALFGNAYREYKKNVPRLMPSLPLLFKKNIGGYLPLKFLWIRKEAGSALAVLFFIFLWEFWRCLQGADLRIYLQEAIGMFALILLFIGIAGYLIRRTAASQGERCCK